MKSSDKSQPNQQALDYINEIARLTEQVTEITATIEKFRKSQRELFNQSDEVFLQLSRARGIKGTIKKDEKSINQLMDFALINPDLKPLADQLNYLAARDAVTRRIIANQERTLRETKANLKRAERALLESIKQTPISVKPLYSSPQSPEPPKPGPVEAEKNERDVLQESTRQKKRRERVAAAKVLAEKVEPTPLADESRMLRELSAALTQSAPTRSRTPSPSIEEQIDREIESALEGLFRQHGLTQKLQKECLLLPEVVSIKTDLVLDSKLTEPASSTLPDLERRLKEIRHIVSKHLKPESARSETPDSRSPTSASEEVASPRTESPIKSAKAKGASHKGMFKPIESRAKWTVINPEYVERFEEAVCHKAKQIIAEIEDLGPRSQDIKGIRQNTAKHTRTKINHAHFQTSLSTATMVLEWEIISSEKHYVVLTRLATHENFKYKQEYFDKERCEKLIEAYEKGLKGPSPEP